MTSQDATADMQRLCPACPPYSGLDEHSHAMTPYHFPAHVHYAVLQDAVIFMDLKSDRYSLLTDEKARLFTALFVPAPRALERALFIDRSAPGRSTRAASSLVTELLDCKLLAPGTDAAPVTRPNLPPPGDDFLADDTDSTHIRLRDIGRFLTACLFAAWRLRSTTIEATVRAVERRRRADTPEHPPDRSALRHLVALFRRLRPLFPKDALCLFDSLALLEFLARYGCFPHWVFAVTLNPWSAHCWVQYADVALNEDAERARHYTVILVA